MRLATSPATAIPARNTAGSRKRSERNTARKRSFVLGAHRVPGGSDLVAHAPHGHDRRGVAQLAAQLPDVHVHRPRVAGEGIAPDALEQLVSREHEPLVIEQLPE